MKHPANIILNPYPVSPVITLKEFVKTIKLAVEMKDKRTLRLLDEVLVNDEWVWRKDADSSR